MVMLLLPSELDELNSTTPGISPRRRSSGAATVLAVGRVPGTADKEWVEYLKDRFASDGHKVPALMKRIALSDGFYAVKLDSDAQSVKEASSR